MSLVRNERLKLTAGWLNALAAGIIIAGAVAPLVAAIYRFPGPTQIGYTAVAVFGIGWLLIGTALHLVARRLLRGLQQ